MSDQKGDNDIDFWAAMLGAVVVGGFVALMVFLACKGALTID